MCVDPLTGALIGTTLLTAGSQIMAGNAQDSAARLNARQYDVQRSEAATETSSALRKRFREYEQVSGLNTVAAALSGLAVSSFDATTGANLGVALEDLRTITASGASREGALATAAATERARGKSAKQASRFEAFSTVAGAAITYETNRGPDQGSLFSIFGEK